jgi:ankyrin repeat protein
MDRYLSIPLHHASNNVNASLEIISYLIQMKSNLHLMDGFGQTSLSCIENNISFMRKVIEEFGDKDQLQQKLTTYFKN